jgi:hypothetical protein
VWEALEAAGRVWTFHGQAALALADAIDRSAWTEPGPGLASAVRELGCAMDRALAPLPQAGRNVIRIDRRAVMSDEQDRQQAQRDAAEQRRAEEARRQAEADERQRQIDGGMGGLK